VQEGKIQETDLDKKVHKVLKVKHDYGLFETGGIKKENPEEVMNNGENRPIPVCWPKFVRTKTKK